jgi:cysteine-rich repeat protein
MPRPLPSRTPIRSAALALLVPWLSAAPAGALSFGDDFGSDSLDPFYWEVSTTNLTTTDTSSGRLVLTQLGGAGVTRVTFRHPMEGDYTVTVDYELLEWPADNRERLALLELAIGAAERISDSAFGGEVYLSDLRPTGVITSGIPTAHTTGTMRFQRIGGQICASFLDGAAFTDFQCVTDPSGAAGSFALQMWRDLSGGDGIQVALDGFQIEAPDGSICGDGAEDGSEECDDGNTAAGDGCDEACQEESGSACPAAPDPACLNAGKASLSVLEKKPGKEKLKLALKKLAGDVPLADLGDPVAGTTRYDVCLYGGASQLVAELSVDRAAESCGSKPCWKAAGGAGFKYKDAEAAASGVSKLSLKSGAAGKGALSLQAGNRTDRGQSSLPTGIAAALQGALAATVQVHTDVPSCFQAELGTVKQAGPDRFQASAP